MTQKMPTRSTTPIRKRDWGTTPVLFSLKNVQPMLVAGPARPEGVVAASSSIANSSGELSTDPSVAATYQMGSSSPQGGSPNGHEESRTKPHPAPLKNYNYQNWAASAFVVVLILFVVFISMKKSPTDASVADKQGKDAKSTVAKTTLDQTEKSSKKENASSFANGKPAPSSGFSLDSKLANPSFADATPVAAPEPLKVPDTIVPGLLANGDGTATSTPTSTGANPPAFIASAPATGSSSASSPIADFNNAPMFAAPATSDPLASAPSTLNGTTKSDMSSSPFSGTSNSSNPSGMSLEVAKPQLQLGPAAPNSVSGNMTSPAMTTESTVGGYMPIATQAANDVAVNIQQTLTPDKPLAELKQLYDEAKRFSGEVVSNPSAGAVNAVPVSAASPAGYQPMYGATGANTNIAPSATTQQNVGTQLSGQAYPPTTQSYQPISVQDSGATPNRYQPIRQPTSSSTAPTSTAPAATPYVPVTPANPYMPVGATSFPTAN